MKGKIALIQILLICVIIVCSITVFNDASDKNKSQTNIDEIKTELATEKPQEENADNESSMDKVRELHEKNPDTIGWVRIDGTNIDYPVMHNNKSNAFYLHRDFNKEYSSSGIPFLDYQCKPDASSDNTIIYAHNMRNGTMFHDLLNYKDEAFLSAHRIIEFDTLSAIGKYEIFAVLRTQVGAKNEFLYYDFVDASSPAEFDEFIAKCIKLSIHKSDIIPKYGDKILTLSTCSYNVNNERFVVFAKKIQKN